MSVLWISRSKSAPIWKPLMNISEELELVFGGNHGLEIFFILSVLDEAHFLGLKVSVIRLFQNPHGIHPFVRLLW